MLGPFVGYQRNNGPFNNRFRAFPATDLDQGAVLEAGKVDKTYILCTVSHYAARDADNCTLCR